MDEAASGGALDGVRRVLDVGGGSGSFAMAFARRRPGLAAVVFDLPNVVPITRPDHWLAVTKVLIRLLRSLPDWSSKKR